jgi:hypothetical protein
VSVETRAYDKPNDDGFPPDLTNTRPTAVTPVNLAGFFMSQDEGGYPELRHAKDSKDAVGVFVCDADGVSLDELVNRAADFEPEPVPPHQQWAVRHPEVLLSVHTSRNAALYTLSKLPGGVLVTRMSDQGDDAWTPETVEVQLPESAEVTS